MQSPSRYQKKIFDFVESGSGNGLVGAVAGSGKTTTIVECARRVNGRSLLVAFNKHIAEALQRKIGRQGEARTLHSVGLQTVRTKIPNGRIEAAKYRRIARECARHHRLPNDKYTSLFKLIEFARLTLTPVNPTAVSQMAKTYNLTYSEDLFKPLEMSLQLGKDRAIKTGEIDYTDMLWLVAELGCKPRSYDWLFVDECQDLNAAQRELAFKLSHGRTLFVGDPQQAIMGFAGADADSYRTIQDASNATHLPLSICYRCPPSHLDLAREIVPAIEAAPGRPPGVLEHTDESRMVRDIREGDMVVCRRNAPLLKHCLRMIQQGKPARVRGADIGKQLAETIRAIGQMGRWVDFLESLTRWNESEKQRLESCDADEAAQQSLKDCYDCIFICWQTYQQACNSADCLAEKLEKIFDDDRAPIWLSSIHRAKGLEAKRVWILEAGKLGQAGPKQSPREAEQEMNLKYVALTRAMEELYLIP